MSVGSRLVGALFSPGQTFADINQRPTWVTPIVIAIVIAFATGVFFNCRLHINWDRFVRERLEAAGNPTPSEEVVQRQVSLAARVTSLTPYISSIATVLICVVLAAIFAMGLMLLEAQTTYKEVLAVVAWSSCGLQLLVAIATVAVLLIGNVTDFDPAKPNMLLSSLAVLVPASAPAAVRTLAASFDLFTFWFNILLVIGFAAIGGSRKITKSKTAG